MWAKSKRKLFRHWQFAHHHECIDLWVISQLDAIILRGIVPWKSGTTFDDQSFEKGVVWVGAGLHGAQKVCSTQDKVTKSWPLGRTTSTLCFLGGIEALSIWRTLRNPGVTLEEKAFLVHFNSYLAAPRGSRTGWSWVFPKSPKSPTTREQLLFELPGRSLKKIPFTGLFFLTWLRTCLV